MAIINMYPRLVVSDAAAAIKFYTAALGATELERFAGPDGKIVHASLSVGGGTIAVKDADDVDPAPTGGGSAVILALDVDDADGMATAILAAGGTTVFPVSDHDYGSRSGRFADPFGHLWIVDQKL